jgi:hypothetical protein
MTDHVYSDKDIFPGWDFDITTEEKISKEPIKILQESLDKMSDQEKKSFARQVVRKHTKYGAVSMFKGVEEIRFAKMKSFAKSVISDLRREIDSIELQISELEKELQESRVCKIINFRLQSREELGILFDLKKKYWRFFLKLFFHSRICII